MDDGLVAGLTGSTAAAVASADLASLAAGDGPHAGAGHGASTTCLNCGTALTPQARFCSQCGQDTANHPPSLFEFVHEFVSHYIAVEGTLWKSLWGLMAKPGFLTREYLAGRKQRYVLPLRLLLTLGLLFFLALKFAPGGSKAAALGEFFDDEDVVASAPAASAKQRKPSAGETGETGRPEAVQERVHRAETQWRADPKGTANAIGATMLGLAPYAVLCSLPFFAGLLKLLFWRQAYGAHFVFAIHLHAAWYAMLLLAVLLPWGVVGFAVWAWSGIYPVVALKRVHAAGWWTTLLRAGLLAMLHWVILGLGLAALVAAGVLAAG